MLTKSIIILLASITFLFSCAAFPPPSEDQNSLLVVSIENNTNSKIKLIFYGKQSLSMVTVREGKQLLFARVFPGDYRIGSIQVIKKPNRGPMALEKPDFSFSVPANAVYLAPKKIKVDENYSAVYSVDARVLEYQDKKETARTIHDYIAFDKWMVKDFSGFEPYQPRLYLQEKMYNVAFKTDPEGAEVIIDGTLLGRTPLNAELEPGKHLITLREKGFRGVKRFYNIQSDQEIAISLKQKPEEAENVPTIESEQSESNKVYLIGVEPFANMGSEYYDSYASVFSDALATGFRQNSKLQVTAIEKDVHIPEPDFREAEKRGADLLVTGAYEVFDKKMLVHARLYDVKTERIKKSDTYSGTAGVATEVYDSIDELMNSFVQGVTRVLPEPGEEIIKKEVVYNQEVKVYEQQINRIQMIDKRLDHRHFLTLSPHIFYTHDLVDNPEFIPGPDAEDSTVRRLPGPPPVGASLNYELVVNRFFSFAAQAGFSIVSSGGEIQGDGVTYMPVSTVIDLPFFFGPQLSFRGLTSDIFFRLMGAAHYSPLHQKYNAYITRNEEDESEKVVQELDYGPYFFTGAVIELGFQTYLNDRFSKNPHYITVGFLTKLLYYRYSLPEWTQYEVPFVIKLSVGYGVGL